MRYTCAVAHFDHKLIVDFLRFWCYSLKQETDSTSTYNTNTCGNVTILHLLYLENNNHASCNTFTALPCLVR